MHHQNIALIYKMTLRKSLAGQKSTNKTTTTFTIKLGLTQQKCVNHHDVLTYRLVRLGATLVTCVGRDLH